MGGLTITRTAIKHTSSNLASRALDKLTTLPLVVGFTPPAFQRIWLQVGVN